MKAFHLSSQAMSASIKSMPKKVPVSAPKTTVTNPSHCARVKMLRIFGTLYFIKMADRKSTRLNSSHVRISYAVFCLKKKKKKNNKTLQNHKLKLYHNDFPSMIYTGLDVRLLTQSLRSMFKAHRDNDVLTVHYSTHRY